MGFFSDQVVMCVDLNDFDARLAIGLHESAVADGRPHRRGKVTVKIGRKRSGVEISRAGYRDIVTGKC